MSVQLIGRFEILGELGKGGQGAVYLARDPQLGRQVAIKTLINLGHKTEQLTCEALIVSKLQHPNIIALYDYGEYQGVPYLAYAYVEGKTLAQLLKQEKVLSFAHAAEITCGVLDGLAYAHSQGISHLDIKPANIMIARSGTPMVMDFGLAAMAGNLEQAGNAPPGGTPRYAAPELIAGQHGDFLSDIYAVGTVLYEMVTGDSRLAAITHTRFLTVRHMGKSPHLLPTMREWAESWKRSFSRLWQKNLASVIRVRMP